MYTVVYLKQINQNDTLYLIHIWKLVEIAKFPIWVDWFRIKGLDSLRCHVEITLTCKIYVGDHNNIILELTLSILGNIIECCQYS